jgi:formylglycine-generating enzyme required for sulfatase activity
MRGSTFLTIGFMSVMMPNLFAAGELSLEMTPKLTLTGPEGSYQIQRAQIVGSATNWIVVTNIYLTNASFVLYHDAAIGTGQQFYRAVQQTPDQINPYPQRLVWVPPGTFTMGSPTTEAGREFDEQPQTQVTLTRGFFIQKFEMTQIEYEALMGANPSEFVALYAPVENVNWSEAVAFCQELTSQDRAAGRLPVGYAYRLPTEAEWEYACRAGTTTRFSYGNDPGLSHLGDYAWFSENSSGRTHPVGQKRANPWGLYDMHGNVWEWCLDWYAISLPGGSVSDPKGPSSGLFRILRGGCWTLLSQYSRSAERYSVSPGEKENCFGFRVVLAPSP